MMGAPFKYSDDRCGKKWKVRLSKIRVEKPGDIAAAVARLLADGKIVGFFQGRSEFGPRALGRRSILADPRNIEMVRILNDKVKHRQWFRPFAPAVLLEYVSQYFDLDAPSPYMLLVASVRKDKQSVVPGITHVDGTARIQTVAPGDDPYRRVIEHFFHLTGVPLILNTSLNDHGEPITESPLDAFACFSGTLMDALAMGPFLVTKEDDNG